MHVRMIALVVLIVALGACNVRQGSGNVVSETREVSDFTAIELTGAGKLNITQTGTESLTVAADDNLIDHITTEVRDDTLVIGFEQGFEMINPTNLEYTVTVRDLNELTVSGAGAVNASGLEGDTLSVNSSGAGAIDVAGQVTSQDISLSGAGRYDAADLESQTADVTISGLGSVVVNVSDALDVTISGAGSVEYIGDPVVTEDISGAGSVTRR